MRAAVNQAFHHPVTQQLVPVGTVLLDAEVDVILKHPECAHRLSVTDRTPSPVTEERVVAPEPPPARLASATEKE